jgi:hypothetical protein
LQHWTNLLKKHAQGRRALQKLGYCFSVHLLPENDFPVTLTHVHCDLFARARCAVVVEDHEYA